MKKKFILLVLFSFITILCSSCQKMIEARNKARLELYNNISEIGNNPNYSICYNGGYVVGDEVIDFSNIITKKIEKDGKKINTKDLIRFIRIAEEDVVSFVYRYKTTKKIGLLFNKNNYYAVGTMSLKDYSISVNYFNCKYESITSFYLTNSHHRFILLDNDEKKDDKYVSSYMTVDRTTGKLEEYKTESDSISVSGETLASYQNPTKYYFDNREYEVKEKYITSNTFEVEVPEFSYVMERSKELTKIAELIGNECYYNEGSFFTNGEDLFIGYFETIGMFGDMGRLEFPVIFKCDLSMENFEYIGCVYYLNSDFYQTIEINRV